MEIVVGSFEAKNKLSALMDKALAGDTVCITRRGKPIIKLVPIYSDEEKPRPVFGCLKGQIAMTEDFDEPLEDFQDYMR